jgi:hypothetical protein
MNSRREFERNAHILAERMQKGQIIFNQEMIKTIDGLTKVRQLPNMRIDLHTINEMARLMMNTASHFDAIREDENTDNDKIDSI